MRTEAIRDGRINVWIESPAISGGNFLEEMLTIEMFEIAEARNETFRVGFVAGGEIISGVEKIVTDAAASDDGIRPNDGADEGYAVSRRLLVLFMRMQSEMKFVEEKFANRLNIAQELRLLRQRAKNIEIIDIATVMFIA